MSNPSILLPAFDVIIRCHISWWQLARKLLWHLPDFYSHANKASFNTIKFEMKANTKEELNTYYMVAVSSNSGTKTTGKNRGLAYNICYLCDFISAHQNLCQNITIEWVKITHSWILTGQDQWSHE